MKKIDESIFRFIQRESLIKSKDRILIACSGGVDSIALLHFFAVNREKLEISVAAVHVNHMLRGQESAADGVLVNKFCKTIGIPFFGGHVPVPDILEKEGGNIQAICRQGRYDYFSKIMREHDYNSLATAHHAEDQLETILMQVTKGMTPSGIPIKRNIDGGMLIRPFLPAVKSSLYAYANENELPFNEDPSNVSDAYMRNRFRRHVVPHILSENSKAPERVVTMSSQLQEDEAFLSTLAKERLEEIVGFTDEGLPTISRRTFNDMPTTLQRRMIPLLLGYLYNETNVHIHYKSGLIEQMIGHLDSEDGNISLNLPLGYRFLREYDKLTFVSERNLSKTSQREKTIIPKAVRTDWMDGIWLYWTDVESVNNDILLNAKEVMYFDLPSDLFPLAVRSRQNGDRIMLPGMSNLKRLSRLFIDDKVSQTMRDSLPVVVTNRDEVCAVPGLRYSAAFTKNRTVASKYIFILGEK